MESLKQKIPSSTPSINAFSKASAENTVFLNPKDDASKSFKKKLNMKLKCKKLINIKLLV